jgi:hypothetical protein
MIERIAGLRGQDWFMRHGLAEIVSDGNCFSL